MSDAKIHDAAHGGITLARFTALSALARMPQAGSLRDALAGDGLSEADWKAAQTAWNRAIEADLEGADAGLVVAFAEGLTEARDRLRRGSAEGPSSAFDPEGPTPLPPSVSPPAPRLLPASQPSSGLSPWARGIASPLPPPAPATASVAAVAPIAAPAFVAPSAAVMTAAAEGERAELNETAHLPLRAFAIAKILPFGAGGRPSSSLPSSLPSSSPSPEGLPAPSIAADDPGETRALSVSSLGGTADLVIPRVLPKPLPFKGGDAPPAVSPGPAQPFPATSPSPNPAPARVAGPASARAATLISGRDPAPQIAAAPPAVPRLTLEQYASLSAERAEHPERDLQIRARYYVAQDAVWAALQREWQQRMDADPSLRLRLGDLVNHYRKWLQRTGG